MDGRYTLGLLRHIQTRSNGSPRSRLQGRQHQPTGSRRATGR
jgi:hypothetical protein